PVVAKWLGLAAREEKAIYSPIEFNQQENVDMELIKLNVPDNGVFKNKSLVEIPSLQGSLVVLIHRNGKYFVPSGGTVLEPGDMIEVLVQKDQKEALLKTFENSPVS
ncbi:MAG TPA: TrkA C-terminal domain-containing protein, partial [Cytophagaceae bacterium]